MTDQDKSRAQLIAELGELRRRLAELEGTGSHRPRDDGGAPLDNTRFQLLFDAMSDGVCLHELILDDNDQPIDYRILDVNPQYEQILGLNREDVLGKAASEIFGSDEPPYLDTYARVAQSGKPCWFETYFQQLEKRFSISVFSPDENRFATIFEDITDRLRPSGGYLENESHFRELAEMLPEAVVETDPNLKLTYANQRMFELSGYRPRDLDRGLNGLDLIVPEERNRARVLLTARFKGEDLGLTEFQSLRKDGSRFPVLLHLSPISYMDNISGFRGIIIDITDRKRTEQKLLESEEKLRNILEHSTNMFYSHTTDHVLTYLSPQVEEILGVTVEEAMVRWTEFTTDNPINEQGFQKTMAAIETGVPQPPYELELRHNSGRKMMVEVRERPVVENGKTVAMVGALVDISNRKQAEQELLENRLRLQTIFESSADYLVMLDREHRVQMINRTEPGIELKDIIGKPIYELAIPEDQERIRRHLDRVIEESSSQQYDLEYIRPDGTKTFLSTVSTPIVVDGQVTGSVVSSRDISELRRLEEQYHQAQKVESIGRLAGGVAHDLNNLLSPIIGYGEMLLDDLGREDTRREAVDEILQAGFRARDLVRQLLAFSRKQTLEYKPVDMNQAVAGIEKLLRRAIRENVEIKFETAAEMQPVMADIGQIEQVILNLAVNAQDAMPEGGRLTITTAMLELGPAEDDGLEETPPGPYVILTIRDNGCGMEPETRKHLFEPFYSTKGDQGTGLGLATVYGIIKQHEGNILVESEPGKGSTFKIYLPVSTDARLMKTATPKAPGGLSGFETILLVEDSPQVRNFVLAILERQGYTVLAAESGAEAKKILAAHDGPVHLLLTDVIMPVMNGKELFNTVSARYPDLKVLYMSGYTDDVIARQGVLDEGVSFIQKPFTISTLSSKVRQVLETEPFD